MKGEKEEKKKNAKMYALVGVLLFALLGISLFTFVPWSTLFPPETTPASAVLTESTFTLIDYRTGEDVTPWVEISVWTPDADDLPFDNDDAQTLANFDEKVSSSDAKDVDIDLRSYSTAWLEIDPDFESDYGGYNDGAFSTIASRDFRKIYGGTNFNYRVFVYHIPTNVSVEMASRGAMDAVDGQADDLSALGDGRAYNNTVNTVGTYARATDGTYTVSLNMPYQSTVGYHAGDTGGDEWDMDADELADIVADAAIHSYDIDYDLLWLQDQKNHRTIAPLYDLTDDTNDAFDSEIERYTNCFTVRITMNTTISETDGNAAQVNVTVMTRDGKDIPAEVIIHTTFIDFIFYEPIVCYDNKYNFDVRLEFGDDLLLSSVTTNRQLTPSDRNNLGAVALLNTMQLEVLALD